MTKRALKIRQQVVANKTKRKRGKDTAGEGYTSKRQKKGERKLFEKKRQATAHREKKSKKMGQMVTLDWGTKKQTMGGKRKKRVIKRTKKKDRPSRKKKTIPIYPD